MYAIVEIAGQQYKVEKDQQIFVHRLEGEEGSKVTFDNVLLTADGDKIQVGAPAVEGISVSGKILEHLKGDKVIVFKKKRRKGYKKRNGHRQYMTKVEIIGFGKGSAKKAAPKKTEAVKEEAPKAAPKAAAPKVEAKAAPAPKKTAAKADDLKKIEGIGPKIASTLIEAGIATFEALSKSTPEAISTIIADVRGNHVTDTWPAQAKMAAEGKWDELKKWQDELDGGKA